MKIAWLFFLSVFGLHCMQESFQSKSKTRNVYATSYTEENIIAYKEARRIVCEMEEKNICSIYIGQALLYHHNATINPLLLHEKTENIVLSPALLEGLSNIHGSKNPTILVVFTPSNQTTH
jgi:hypothetical protein